MTTAKPSRTSAALPADVGIVTVSYNSSGQLETFLPGAVASLRTPSHVVVTDNDSADIQATTQLAATWGAQVVRLDRNAGYGAAANAGVAALPAACTAVLISNPDVTLTTETVSRLRDALLADPAIGIVGPRILNADGSAYPSARAIPSIRTGTGHALFSRVWPRNPWTRRYHSDAFRGDVNTDAGWLSGACLMLRRSTFEALGGFDEHYFMYFEDVDLGYRAGRRGLRNVYVPGAVVTHIGGETTRVNRRAMLAAHHDSAKKFIATKYAGPVWAPVRLVLRIGLNLRLRLESRS
ncbi:MAG: glycosyltransferase family 2 protein [Aurantimicrobium sp.]|nr:glycosyltransferase family 2 protein [Aurantimicrobium sp.]